MAPLRRRGWLAVAAATAASAARAQGLIPNDAGRMRITVMGDSMAHDLAFALAGIARTDRVVLEELRRDGTGLFNADVQRASFTGWRREAEAMLRSGTVPASAAVILLGLNDWQPLAFGDGRPAIAFASPGHAEEYIARVRTLQAACGALSRCVMWVGLPRMGLPGRDEQMRVLDGLMRTALAGTPARFLDLQAQTTVQGGYHPNGWGGQVQAHRLRVEYWVNPDRERVPDESHFNPAGARLLARLVASEIEAALRLPPGRLTRPA